MLDIKEKSDCCGCTSCQNICPRNAISMIDDEKGFKYPNINYNACINCGLCEKVCPIINKKQESGNLPNAYAAYNKDEKIRMQSSSGGIFTLIACEIIKNNGIVFGATFDEMFHVVHREAESIDELEKFRSSKYMQSDLNDVFKQVKAFLEDNRHVLFTGTPCQIEGLKAFLGREYDKLYTQDLICHGVPSKKVWEKYLKYRISKNNDCIKTISFRNKENKGWNKYQLKFTYKNTMEYIDHSEDLYMKIFLSDIALRDSCYSCKFKKKRRVSDITLADFWGIDKILPEMNDEKGTSLVIVNSSKGQELFNSLKSNIIYKEVDFEMAISHNPSMTKSPAKSECREDVFKNLEKYQIEDIVNTYINKG